MKPFAPIAIVGRACVLPGALSPEALWEAVVEGRDLVGPVPADRWDLAPDDVMCAGAEGIDTTDRTWSDRGGYVHGFEEIFDPSGFGLSLDEVCALDPVFQWTLHTAREALRDAGRVDDDPARMGAIFGNLSFPSASMAAFHAATSISLAPGYGSDALADAGLVMPDARNRFTSGLPALLLERALSLGAGAHALDAACASSLYAIKLACDRLHYGEADLMLAGAVNCADDLCIHLGFAALQALSRTGRSRPFHQEADGLVPAEGCGFVALRRLEDAVADGDVIHGIIRGVGLSNDGRGRGLLVPSQDGQTRAIQEAIDRSGCDPKGISLLECHATGTQVGDVTEIHSSAAVYSSVDGMPIGSLKSNMGHLITAAGVAGLIKTLEAMRHETRAPTLHVDQPLDAIAASPFRVLDQVEPWDRSDSVDGVLRAGVSAFGFGGNNAHLIVEEPATAVALVERDAQQTSRPSAGVAGEPIAIVGIGVIAAGAMGFEEFASAVVEARPCLDQAGEGSMPDLTLRLKGLKFPPKDLDSALPQQLAMLQVTDEALAQTGPLPLASTGVYVGMGTDPEAARFGVRWRLATWARRWNQDPSWVDEARDDVGPPLDAAGVLGTMPNIPANRLNSQFDLAGPSFTVSSEEHSGLDALTVACRALRDGDLDAALVGAVDLCCDPVHRAAADACLPPDRRVPGDAAVVLVLKRLSDAERDGDTVRAVLPDARRDALGAVQDDRPDLTVSLGALPGCTSLFGHAHAASGLVHVAAAAVSLHRRLAPGGAPLIASNPESGSGLPPGVGPRTVGVEIRAMDGIVNRSVLLAESTESLPVSSGSRLRLHVFSGSDGAHVLDNLASRQESFGGPARLVIVADGEEQLAARAERASAHISEGRPPGEGVHYRSEPLAGEVAFVFTAAGAAYAGMGSQLLEALPELASPISETFPLGEAAGWVYQPDVTPTPSDYLWGTSLLSQAHARLTRGLLGLRPSAAIGYSSGESNSLYAFGVWSDMAAMRREIDASGMMERELGVSFEAVARAWGDESATWSVWNVLLPVDVVRAAIAGESRVHLAIINTATDVVIGGDAIACNRVVEALGRTRCREVGYNLACHVPEVAEAFHQPWLDIHTRSVTPASGVRFYSNGVGGAYDVSTDACAQAITAQAEHTVDFPVTVEAAYEDGVRIFVEHGPAGACTNFIRTILADRDILAVHLDRRDKNIEQVFEVAAALTAVGVHVDHAALTDRLTAPAIDSTEADDGGPTRTFPSHRARLHLPPRISVDPNLGAPTVSSNGHGSGSVQWMAPAPTLVSVHDRSIPVGPQATLVSVIEAPLVHAASGTAAAAVQQHLAQVSAIHDAYVHHQTQLHEQFLASRQQAFEALTGGVAPAALLTPPSPVLASPEPMRADPASPVASDRIVFRPTGPVWDKEQVKIHSSGRISELFGPQFVGQDQHTRQCRMPEPPLLLADRVVGLDAEPAVLGRGTIWTETDVEAGAWYLNDGYMPAGFMIESGQADLMLISYMGIDLANDAERVYRLLGCTLTYHGDLPSPGETLEYEIRINGHARHGDVRLFFFEYDCIVDGQPRLTVRDGQAGFFSDQELADALGVLWTPETGRVDLSSDARVDPPSVVGTKSSFTRDDVVSFSEGRVLDCFGPGFEWTETHTRTPSIQGGNQLFIHEVSDFDPEGGPWGRGFLRCETVVGDDDWFFDGHFKNDPCMPGNFMVEACVEAMSFYLTALGYTTRRDGWRFQPLPEHSFDLKCRGEINPRSERVTYELHVEEVWDGPHPTVICDVIGYVDGKAAFHGHRLGVELTPDWPLTSRPEIYDQVVEPVEVATDAEGFRFDWKAMIACAWGRPSDAFGRMYEMFDGIRRSPRLPGAPYHFMSRILKIDGDLDVCQPGMKIVCEYDIPADVWYFDENGTETMPFAVLLEAALQPCGWVASAIGSVTKLEDDLLFRNLDGTGTLVSELTRTAGTLRTQVECTSVSRAGGMIIEGFDVECYLGDRLVYTMDTVFGFFPTEAFDNQVGLPIDDERRSHLEMTGGDTVDLTLRPERYCAGDARLAQPMLLMLDRATVFAGAGEAGLGLLRGEKDVDVSEWFFKAHFFQDPVQPGSLGIEALIQLLQVFMLHEGMDEGVTDAHFEPLMLDAPMTWKYRGQVTPKNKLITSTVEITEVGADDRGPFVIGRGSLWCDGLRIYETSNMGMRIVSGPPTGSTGPLGSSALLDLTADGQSCRSLLREFWNPRLGTPDGWLGEDLVSALIDRFVNRVLVHDATLARLRGQPAIYLGNHQVQVESLVVTNLLPALTGLPMRTVANAIHEHRWIGRLLRDLQAYPGFVPFEQIAYFRQEDPESMLAILDRVRTDMAAGQLSFFVHPEGGRAQSCRDRTTRCSSLFTDLALELDVPIVPLRFTGGLPVEPIEGKADFPWNYGRQDYWIGEPIEADELRALPLRARVDRVVDAINDLGISPETEVPSAGDPTFGEAVDLWAKERGTHKVFAAGWQLLGSMNDGGIELDALREGLPHYHSDGTPVGDWIGRMADLLHGPEPLAIAVDAESHPHLIDHAVDGTVVIPAVYAVEWMTRAARRVIDAPPGRPTPAASLAGLKVFKGITLPDFGIGGSVDLVAVVTGQANEGADTVVDVILRDASSGRPHYGTTVTLSPAMDLDLAGDSIPSVSSGGAGSGVGEATLEVDEIYGGVLFHGPRFQALSDVRPTPESGLTATTIGVLDLDWPDESWSTDPARLDAVLQLALLWSETALGGASLPTSIGGISVLTPPQPGPLVATLTPGEIHANRATCDVTISDLEGVPVVVLTDIETHRLVSGAG